MVNEILMRGATPIAPIAPVEAPPSPAGGDFSQALLAELDGPAPAASQGAPVLGPPKALTLDAIPVAPPAMVAPPPLAPPATPSTGGGTYTVQAGDSLSKIARKLGHGSWQKLYAANKAVVGADPDTIHPGQVLTLPTAWQTAAASAVAKAPAAQAPRVQAAVEPAAKAPTVVAGTAPAQVPSAPIVAPPSLTREAAVEPTPGQAPVEAADAPNPAVVGIATEAIDRLTSEAGGRQDHVATLREALKSIPPGHASYEAYKAKVEAYESAVGAGPAPAMAAPSLPAAPAPAQDGAAPMNGPEPMNGPGPMNGPAPTTDATAAMPPIGGVAPTAQEVPGTTIDAQLTMPATPLVAPAPSAEDAGDAAAEDGEESWQAFS